MSEPSDITLELDRRPSRLAWWLHPKVAIPLMFFVLLLFSPFLIRGYRISQLPDIGEPFDVAALLKSLPPPDDQAKKLLAEAKKLHREPMSAELDLISQVNESGWTPAADPLRTWLSDNTGMLREFRRAIELEAWSRPFQTNHDVEAVNESVQLQSAFLRLAQTQAECSLADGDADASWVWIHLMLRQSGHVARHGEQINRLVADALTAVAFHSVQRFTESPIVTSDQLRRALADLQRFHAALPSKSDAFRWKYARNLKERIRLDDLQMLNWLGQSPDGHDLRNVPTSLRTKALWLLGDPDFSDRAVKLLIRNWIGEADLPPFRRSRALGSWVKVFDSPGSSSRISNEKLAQKVNDRCLAKFYLGDGIRAIESMDRTDARWPAIELVAACQLYHRLHGEFPPTLLDLVPDILTALPVDPFSRSAATYRYLHDGERVVIYSLGKNETDEGGLIDYQIDYEKRDEGFRTDPPPR